MLAGTTDDISMIFSSKGAAECERENNLKGSTRGYSFLEATELITSFISSYLLTRLYIYIYLNKYIYIHIFKYISQSLYIIFFI